MQPNPAKAAARAAGHKTYQGTPCKHGHTTRWSNGGGCVDCSRAAVIAHSKTEKGRAYRAKWRRQPRVRAKEREYAVWYSKRWRYGIEKEHFEALLERCGWKCESCSKELQRNSQRNGPCVDHDHETGNVRGILCHSCNRALGLLKDSTSIIQKLLEYLKCHTRK